MYATVITGLMTKSIYLNEYYNLMPHVRNIKLFKCCSCHVQKLKNITTNYLQCLYDENGRVTRSLVLTIYQFKVWCS